MQIMIVKNNQKSNVAAFKADFRVKLDRLKNDLTHSDKMRIAIELNLSLSTVERYVSGGVDELRKLELAESILSTAKEVLRLKNEQAPAPSTV